ncbi:hypothetical protein O1611_g2655 [Lasiodiplodia mahajangana]|uniref:Uncharacterized protein n=1 Tax=Lasiodiplodia mahajangana TaxID=1108764 RepID=A0ACC2JUU7_9PEZI|nr:hypothetical protein O1611_g2655 [Lasiodiplodia mahajangana]
MAESKNRVTEVKSLGEDVASYFTDPRIRFTGFAGLGNHGGALILTEEASDEHEARTVVVKYSYGSLSFDERTNADNDLRNEYHLLKRLQGAEHIVQLVPMADCSINIPGTSNGKATYYESILSQQSQKASVEVSQSMTASTRRCPTFALEHLPYSLILGEGNLKMMKLQTGELDLSRTVMMRLCCLGIREHTPFALLDRAILYYYEDELGVEHDVQTRAPKVLRGNPIIDPQLRHLLVRCMAYPYSEIPSLKPVLEETEKAIRDKGPNYPGLVTPLAAALGVSETDDAIREFFQRFIYNAG